MRHLKTLTLAAMAVFALVAFAGAGTASAVSLCTVNTSPCPAGSIVPANTNFVGHLTSGQKAVLQTSGGFINPTVSCSASTVTVKNTAASGSPLPGQVTALSFDNGGTPVQPCTETNPGGTCTVTVNGLAYNGNITASGGGNGTLNVTNPNVTVNCTAPFASSCTYTTPNISGTFVGGSPAEVVYTNAPLTSASGFPCPTNATWTATYAVTSPNPLFVTAAP